MIRNLDLLVERIKMSCNSDIIQSQSKYKKFFTEIEKKKKTILKLLGHIGEGGYSSITQ